MLHLHAQRGIDKYAGNVLLLSLGFITEGHILQALPFCLYVSMSKPYHNVLAPDLMGAGLTGLFHPCAFHLELIHSAYSVHQCTWKVSDYIFCLRVVYLPQWMNHIIAHRLIYHHLQIHETESQQVCHVYANAICIHDAIKQAGQFVFIYIK